MSLIDEIRASNTNGTIETFSGFVGKNVPYELYGRGILKLLICASERVSLSDCKLYIDEQIIDKSFLIEKHPENNRYRLNTELSFNKSIKIESMSSNSDSNHYYYLIQIKK